MDYYSEKEARTMATFGVIREGVKWYAAVAFTGYFVSQWVVPFVRALS